jgi:hypothetical protein
MAVILNITPIDSGSIAQCLDGKGISLNPETLGISPEHITQEPQLGFSPKGLVL